MPSTSTCFQVSDPRPNPWVVRLFALFAADIIIATTLFCFFLLNQNKINPETANSIMLFSLRYGMYLFVFLPLLTICIFMFWDGIRKRAQFYIVGNMLRIKSGKKEIEIKKNEIREIMLKDLLFLA